MNKVNELLTQELSKIFLKEYQEDFGFISLTYVLCAPDLKTAEVGISLFNKSNQEMLVKKLNIDSEKIRRMLGQSIVLKNMPKINFKQDNGVEKVIQIESILNKISKENKNEN